MKEKHFSRYEKDGKLKVTGNELLVSLDDIKSIEYPRVQLGNCFRGRNVYFFLLSDSFPTPLPVEERPTSRGIGGFASFRCLQLLTLPPRRARRAFPKAP